MFSSLKTRFFLATIVGLTLFLPLPSLAAEKAAEKENPVFGDWTFICEKDKEGKKQCEIAQTQMMKDKKGETKGRLLRLAFARRPDGKNIIHALLPLGLAIPAGVGIVIDEGEQLNMILQRCTGMGCEAVALVDDSYLEKMKKGNIAKVGFKAGEKTMVIQSSLKGFGRALQELK